MPLGGSLHGLCASQLYNTQKYWERGGFLWKPPGGCGFFWAKNWGDEVAVEWLVPIGWRLFGGFFHPRSLTVRPWKWTIPKRTVLFHIFFFRGYVNLRGSSKQLLALFEVLLYYLKIFGVLGKTGFFKSIYDVGIGLVIYLDEWCSTWVNGRYPLGGTLHTLTLQRHTMRNIFSSNHGYSGRHISGIQLTQIFQPLFCETLDGSVTRSIKNSGKWNMVVSTSHGRIFDANDHSNKWGWNR